MSVMYLAWREERVLRLLLAVMQSAFLPERQSALDQSFPTTFLGSLYKVQPMADLVFPDIRASRYMYLHVLLLVLEEVRVF